jgi:hypothetical protein
MNHSTLATDNPLAGASREDLQSALFANLVLQQANMALMFLGKAPHPEKGELVIDLDAAQVFVEMLEMLEAKTKNNLAKPEEAMLRQSLMNVRLAFVEAADKAPATPAGAPASTAAAPPAQPSTAAQPPQADAEDRKKYVKKY